MSKQGPPKNPNASGPTWEQTRARLREAASRMAQESGTPAPPAAPTQATRAPRPQTRRQARPQPRPEPAPAPADAEAKVDRQANGQAEEGPTVRPAYQPPVDLNAMDVALLSAVPTHAAPAPSTPSTPAWTTPASTPSHQVPAAYAPTVDAGRSGRTKIVAGVVIGALALAGAGTGLFLATHSSAPSKSSYIAKADAVCASTNRTLAAIAKPTSYPELATASGTVASATSAEVVKLRALARPSGSAGTSAGSVIASLEATGKAAGQLQSAAGASDDAATIAAARSLNTSLASAASGAKAYGFTACGTGDQSGVEAVTGGTTAIIKTGFIAKAETLCRAAARQMDSVPDPTSGSGPAIGRYLSQEAAIADKLLTDIKALPVPPGDEATVADMLAAQDTEDGSFHAMADAASAGDVARFQAAAMDDDRNTSASDAKWDAYGLSVCGSNFGES